MKHFTGHEIHDSEQTNGLIVFVVVGHPAGMSWFHKGDRRSFDVTCRLRKCKWQITQGICNLLHHTLVTLPDNTRTDSSRENTLRSKESPDSSEPSFRLVRDNHMPSHRRNQKLHFQGVSDVVENQ